jgi:hypothetical protein
MMVVTLYDEHVKISHFFFQSCRTMVKRTKMAE